MSIIVLGFLASLVAGLATFVGALPVLGQRRPSEAQQTILLGFAAGVMLAASFFSLIIPGLEEAEGAGASRAGAAGTVIAAILLGGAAVSLIGRVVPTIEQLGAESAAARRIWLFVAAITFHNLPEGLAVGTSFGTGDLEAGRAVALGIGLQNIPEGLAVAVALTTLGHSPRFALGIALLSGLVEPVGGLIGVTLTSSSSALLPWGLGFAAGAMIFVVASEVIPEVQARRGRGRASHGLMIGLAAMMFLDVTLG